MYIYSIYSFSRGKRSTRSKGLFSSATVPDILRFRVVGRSALTRSANYEQLLEVRIFRISISNHTSFDQLQLDSSTREEDAAKEKKEREFQTATFKS